MTILLTPVEHAAPDALAEADLTLDVRPGPESVSRFSGPIDPFEVPTDTVPIAQATARRRVAVAGTVTGVRVERWHGGPTLEVTVQDATGGLILAFLGRRQAVLGLGTDVVAFGTVCRHAGRLVLLNPYKWVVGPVIGG